MCLYVTVCGVYCCGFVVGCYWFVCIYCWYLFRLIEVSLTCFLRLGGLIVCVLLFFGLIMRCAFVVELVILLFDFVV